MCATPYTELLVFGAGALGSYFGAKLTPHIDTTLICRANHRDAISTHGLKIGGKIKLTSHPKVKTTPPPLGKNALVLLAVKSRDLKSAAKQLANIIRPDTHIICLQNGLEPERVFIDELKSLTDMRPLQIFRALVSAGCDFVAPGQIEYWGGGVSISTEPKLDALEELLKSADIKLQREQDFKLAVWTKFAVNCIANPLTAILNCRNAEIITEVLLPTRRQIFEEVRAVASAKGVELNSSLFEALDNALLGSNNRNSMHQDITKGRETEIADLSMLVVKLGRELKIPTPANEIMAALVSSIESNN